MSNTSKLQKKIDSSSQFRQVASFIKEISDVDGVNIVDDVFKYLTVCPWTDKKLDTTVQNINTTLFCQLFSMKPTSCERHLRLYKELTAKI